MRINSPFLKQLGGLGISTLVRHWMKTLDYRHAPYDDSVDPAGANFGGPAIFLFWHEYIPFLFYLRGHCRISMLVSRHADAEWLSCAARHMGFRLIRGSTNRGGVASYLGLCAYIEHFLPYRETVKQQITTQLAAYRERERVLRNEAVAVAEAS